MERGSRTAAGAACVLGAVTLVAFVLAKEWWLPAYGPLLLFEDGTGLAFHLTENVPLALVGAGLFGLLSVARAAGDRPAVAGAGVALLGAGTALVAHTAEHLLFTVGLSALGVAFMWAFYLGWGLLATGLSVVGLRADRLSLLAPHERVVLLGVLPLAVVAAAVLGSLWFRAVADGFKLPVAAGLAVVGYRLHRPWTADARTDDVDRSDPAD